MPIFTIETTYRLPVYRQRSYEAETLDTACALAIADEGWDDEKSDVETSGDTYVTGAWDGRDAARDRGWHVVPGRDDGLRSAAQLLVPHRPIFPAFHSRWRHADIY